MPPHRREGNTKPRALLVTSGSEGRLSKYWELSESEPNVAGSRGKVAKSADARNPDTAKCYNGGISILDSLVNGGSLYICSARCGTKRKRAARRGTVKDMEMADESVVVIKSMPVKPW